MDEPVPTGPGPEPVPAPAPEPSPRVKRVYRKRAKTNPMLCSYNSAMTPDQVREIATKWFNGMSIIQALHSLGYSITPWNTTMETKWAKELFSMTVAQNLASVLDDLRQPSCKNAKALIWLLEQRFPDQFSPRATRKLTDTKEDEMGVPSNVLSELRTRGKNLFSKAQ